MCNKRILKDEYKRYKLHDVSLIIATYNEEESLGYVLNEIKDFNIGEIIIIDKNSTDNTKNIAEKYSVKFITQSREGWGGPLKKPLNFHPKNILRIWMVMDLIIRKLYMK